jgi:hypothetical protein
MLDRLLDHFHHNHTAAALLVAALCLVLGMMDMAAPEVLDVSDLFLVPVAAATLFLGWQLGLALALMMAVAHYSAAIIGWPQATYGDATFADLVVHLGMYCTAIYFMRAASQRRQLREENLRLETLRQTMVTVNDIVRNRLQAVNCTLEIAHDEGKLSELQFIRTEQATKEIVEQLNRLGSLQYVHTVQVIDGVDAVQLEDPLPDSYAPVVS